MYVVQAVCIWGSCHVVRIAHRQFLAAFQVFEAMNVDEEAQEGGVGLNLRPFRSPIGKKADFPTPQPPQRKSYQVRKYIYVCIVS